MPKLDHKLMKLIRIAKPGFKLPTRRTMHLRSRTVGHYSVSRFNQLFEHIVYINLPERVDRRKHMEEVLKFNNIIAERVDGVRRSPEEGGGQLGCAMAHVNVLKQFLNSPYQNILIFEDDLEIKPDYLFYLPQKIDFKWDMLFLGVNDARHGPEKFGNFQRLLCGVCTHAYAVNRSCVSLLISEIESRYSSTAVDHIYRSLFQRLLVYAVRPDICFQLFSKFGSNISRRRGAMFI